MPNNPILDNTNIHPTTSQVVDTVRNNSKVNQSRSKYSEAYRDWETDRKSVV